MGKGDHIKAKRLGGLYTHHGIDVGDGTVVHLDGDPFRRKHARVRRVPLEEFARGAQVKPVRHGDVARDPEETVGEAMLRLGEAGYDLFRNNCEHFARGCKSGEPKSHQVERALRAGALTVAGAAVVGGAVVLRVVLGRKKQSGGRA